MKIVRITNDSKFLLANELIEETHELTNNIELDGILRGWSGGYTTNSETPNIYYVKGLRGGFMFPRTIFEVGETYALSFKVIKTSGDIVTIGGHAQSFNNMEVYLDDGLIGNSWNTGLRNTYPNDNLEHSYRVFLTFTDAASDSNLYIQPNRDSGYATEYTAEVYDLKLEKINKRPPNLSLDVLGNLTTIDEIIEYPIELEGGRNLLSTSFQKYDISGLYGYIELVEEDTEMILKVYDRDSSIDMSSIYFGFTGVGYSAEGNVTWSMANGNLQRDEIIQSRHRYFSYYPKNEATFNKIFERFYIKIEKGNKATPWTPAPEDLGLEYSSDIQSFNMGIKGNTLMVTELIEDYGDILVHRYVHTSNKVIQPTGLNKETGLFTTTEPIALAPGTKREVITAFNYQSDGSIPREWRGVDPHYIDVVSSTSFYIRGGSANGEILTYTNTNNNLVDVNSFKFEYDYRNNYQIDLSEFNIKKGRFNFKGTRRRPGWTYIYLGINHSDGNHQHNFGLFADGRDYLSLDVTGLFSIEDNLASARIKNYIKSEWNDNNGTWVDFQGSNGNVLNQSFDNPSFGILNFSYAMANGSVVEIYDIQHSFNSDG